jgi:hypothetical protein
MQHWMIAFCCSSVGCVTYLFALAIGAVGSGLEEELLVVADVLLLVLLVLEDAYPEEVVVVVLLAVGDARSAAMISTSMSSKSSSAAFAFASATHLPFLLFFGILGRKVTFDAAA